MRTDAPRGELRDFTILWLTQSFSTLGSAMTGFALLIWSYRQTGSALSTALLSICSYAPYVLASVFAGALSDRWDRKRTMLWCDAFAALTTLCVLALLRTGTLRVGHLYALNALGGLMNTFQQPASEVAVTSLVPKRHYQRVGGLQSLSGSVVTLLTPALASALLAFGGLETVIAFDLLTCAAAMIALGGFVRIPRKERTEARRASVLQDAKSGLAYLRTHRGVLDLILFLAAINLIASMYNAALPVMLLSRANGGDTALALVNTVTGLATLAGGAAASLLPAPKSRVRAIFASLLVSMGTENLLLALGRTLPVWCVAAALGWLLIPIMNTNMGALLRATIPPEIQGRVYAARNTLQYFTIPIGYLAGGALIDRVYEPLMASLSPDSLPARLVGQGEGSGAALLLLSIAGIGVLICVIFSRDRHIWSLEDSAAPPLQPPQGT